MKYGRLPAKIDSRTLQYEKYALSSLPSPLISCSSLYRMQYELKIGDCVPLFPMDGNDLLGNCTCAGLAHLITLWDGLIGKQTVMPADDVIALYRKLTGGPDTGLACIDVLNYWMNNEVNGHKPLGYVAIDPTNITHVKQAVDIFGSVYIGFKTQSDTLPDFHQGITWQPGQTDNDGHCVVVTAYSPACVRVLTWGGTQLGTWGWFTHMVDECFCVLPDEATVKTFAQGFDLATLQADLQLIRG